MNRLAADRDLLRHMGRQARLRMEEYKWEVYARRLIDAVVGEGNQRPAEVMPAAGGAPADGVAPYRPA